MIRLKRRNTAWLATIGGIIGIALAGGGGDIALPVQAALVSIFGLAMGGSIIERGPNPIALLSALQRTPLKRRVSPQAREAYERAKMRGTYHAPGIYLMDIGLIALQSGEDGIAMRRSRTVSKDDDGVRPFVTLHVDADAADRQSLVRYEILDQNGRNQFIHEERVYLRDGETALLLDHHLPLFDNPNIEGTGDWDLRVYLDDNLIGMHNFTLTASVRERQQHIASQRARQNIMEVYDEAEEVSLKDLMNQQNDRQRRTYRTARRKE